MITLMRRNLVFQLGRHVQTRLTEAGKCPGSGHQAQADGFPQRFMPVCRLANHFEGVFLLQVGHERLPEYLVIISYQDPYLFKRHLQSSPTFQCRQCFSLPNCLRHRSPFTHGWQPDPATADAWDQSPYRHRQWKRRNFLNDVLWPDQIHPGGLGVFDDVGQALLNDTVDIEFDRLSHAGIVSGNRRLINRLPDDSMSFASLRDGIIQAMSSSLVGSTFMITPRISSIADFRDPERLPDIAFDGASLCSRSY